MNDEDLIKHRLENGSYNTICGNENIPVRLIEPLRGMLADDPNERWTFGEINNWLTGQTINSVKRKPNKSPIYLSISRTSVFQSSTPSIAIYTFPKGCDKSDKIRSIYYLVGTWPQATSRSACDPWCHSKC